METMKVVSSKTWRRFCTCVFIRTKDQNVIDINKIEWKENSAWVEANFSGSRRQDLAIKGGLGWLGCGGRGCDVDLQLGACRSKLHWRIHVINPGWLEE